MARLYAATGDGIVRLDEASCDWIVEHFLGGSGAQCLAVDPHDADMLYAGLREQGVRRTQDGGAAGSIARCLSPASSRSRSAPPTVPFTRAPSRAGCSAATIAARAGANSGACSTCPLGRGGASRPGRGHRTCAGSPRVRTTLICSWSGSNSAAWCARAMAARPGRTTARERRGTCTHSPGTRTSMTGPTRRVAEAPRTARTRARAGSRPTKA
jgi:hypothetical protein